MQKQILKIIFLLTVFLMLPKNVSAMIHLNEPIAISSATTLTDDYECDQSCFIVKGSNYVFDFGGHTATYGNSNIVTVPNDTFSSWMNDTVPNNWTVTNGFATRTNTIYPFGSPYDATLSATADIRSDNFTLTANKTYIAFAFARGAFADSYLLEIVSAADDVVLASQTVNGGILNRGYGDSGDPSNNLKYKPVGNADVYLRFTGIGTGTKILGMLSMKPAFDYGIVQGSYQSSIYEPDGPNLYGGATNVTIRNGTITQGAGDGVRSPGMFIAGTDFNINNMVVNVSGINSGGIDAMYPSGINISNNIINSTSKSVFNRMHGTHGISLSGSVSNKSYVVFNNILNGMPEGGIFSYACFTATDTTTFNISGNTISQNEVNTEGYGILLSGIINGTVDSNIITPVKGRGILLDAANGCTLPNEKGTLNMTVSNNNIGTIGNPLYEVRNAEYGEDALEVAGIRVRDWGGVGANHRNLKIFGNNIFARTDAAGVHRAYGINLTASAVNEDIEIFNNNVVVSATGAGRDANALSLQGVDMTTGGLLNIHNNTFTSTHEAVRFGGNDGSIVKGVSLFSNTLAQAGTPTVGPIFYGYWSGPYQSNAIYDITCINCAGSGVHNISSAVTSYATSGVNSNCDISIGWKMTVEMGHPGILISATDNLSNIYTATTNASGIAEIYVPQYKKTGVGTTCQASGSFLNALMTTINYSPYTVSASYNGDNYLQNGVVMDSSKTIVLNTGAPDAIAPSAPGGLMVL